MNPLISRNFALSVVFLFTTTSSRAQSPRTCAERIGNRLMADTKFELVQKPMRLEQEKTQIVDFGFKKNFAINVPQTVEFDLEPFTQTGISENGHGTGVAYLSISHAAGRIAVYLNDTLLLEKNNKKPTFPKRLDYDFLKFQHNIPVHFTQEKYRLRIVFTAKNAQNARVYVAFSEKNGMQTGVKTTRLNEEAWQAPPSVSALPDNVGLSDWRYYTGAFLTALFDVSNHFKIDTFKTYFRENTRFFLKNKEKIRAEREKYGLIESPFTLYFRSTMLDDLGTQSLAMLIFARYLDPNDAAANGVYKQAMRDWRKYVTVLPDGTFARLTPDSMTVQSDDLMMGGFSLVRMGQILRDEKMHLAAARASVGYHKYLFDKETKLYRHAFSTKTGEQSCCSWARGLGWMMLTNAELLKNTPPQYLAQKTGIYAQILTEFKATCATLLAYQNENGAFHQVLTDKKTYLETSATAMFVAAFADGVTQGWLPRDQFEGAILRGWSYLQTQIQEDGKVKNIVRGTPILTSADGYNRQRANLNDPRGLGAVLWACIAMDKYLGTGK